MLKQPNIQHWISVWPLAGNCSVAAVSFPMATIQAFVGVVLWCTPLTDTLDASATNNLLDTCLLGQGCLLGRKKHYESVQVFNGSFWLPVDDTYIRSKRAENAERNHDIDDGKRKYWFWRWRLYCWCKLSITFTILKSMTMSFVFWTWVGDSSLGRHPHHHRPPVTGWGWQVSSADLCSADCTCKPTVRVTMGGRTYSLILPVLPSSFKFCFFSAPVSSIHHSADVSAVLLLHCQGANKPWKVSIWRSCDQSLALTWKLSYMRLSQSSPGPRAPCMMSGPQYSEGGRGTDGGPNDSTHSGSQRPALCRCEQFFGSSQRCAVPNLWIWYQLVAT